MAFKSIEAVAVGTTATQLSSGGSPYQTPAGKIDVLIGFQLSNRSNTTITVDAYLKRGGNNIYLVRGAILISGGAEDVMAGRQIMQAGDQLWVVSSAAGSLDAWASFMQDNA